MSEFDYYSEAAHGPHEIFELGLPQLFFRDSFPAPGRPSDGLVVWSFTGGRVSALVLLWLSWFITVPSISHLSADSIPEYLAALFTRLHQ
jgi:hypothetical protein